MDVEETTPESDRSVASVMEHLERLVEKDQCLIVLPISDYLRKPEMKGRELVEVKATSCTSVVSHMSIAVVYLERTVKVHLSLVVCRKLEQDEVMREESMAMAEGMGLQCSEIGECQNGHAPAAGCRCLRGFSLEVQCAVKA